ncbi:MAG: phage portal protein [Planctomycetes bacterium]|nr:phage portal protein [Planctomycetota bacterium]
MLQTATTIENHPLDEQLVAMLIRDHCSHTRPALERLWDYYRNDLDFDFADDKRPYRAAQQQGLPWRLTRTGPAPARPFDADGARREIVIENDIGWRVHTLVDFMFGKSVHIQSRAADPQRAQLIERVLNATFEANGGVCFLQDMALLGGVYGYVDVLLRTDRLPRHISSDGTGMGASAPDQPASEPEPHERAVRFASQLVLETVEAPRAIPVLDPADYRKLVGYILHYTQALNEVDHTSLLSRLVDAGGHPRARQATMEVTEIWTDRGVWTYHDHELVAHTPHRLGVLPVVHMQNLPQPFFYEGLSEVEPLIPLQDELNTRLSDRANRVTMQSFKMYLGKGIDNFVERPIGPGQMWQTDNPEASIETFGGDGESPSEEAHINEIREAMDKTSAVTAVAAGLLRNKVGNLTSENALRIVMMGLLARTQKKRVTYGKGIERVCEMVLRAMHTAGVLRTSDDERRVTLHWPSPLPEDQAQRLAEAKLKLDIGVPREQVLAELGYGATCGAAG